MNMYTHTTIYFSFLPLCRGLYMDSNPRLALWLLNLVFAWYTKFKAPPHTTTICRPLHISLFPLLKQKFLVAVSTSWKSSQYL
jgi:hypothetical protein